MQRCASASSLEVYKREAPTSLHGYLATHPSIRSGDNKELHFFDNETIDWRAPEYARLLDRFELGTAVPAQLIDATPDLHLLAPVRTAHSPVQSARTPHLHLPRPHRTRLVPLADGSAQRRRNRCRSRMRSARGARACLWTRRRKTVGASSATSNVVFTEPRLHGSSTSCRASEFFFSVPMISRTTTQRHCDV